VCYGVASAGRNATPFPFFGLRCRVSSMQQGVHERLHRTMPISYFRAAPAAGPPEEPRHSVWGCNPRPEP
jgi:hypothetical protein